MRQSLSKLVSQALAVKGLPALFPLGIKYSSLGLLLFIVFEPLFNTRVYVFVNPFGDKTF
jgi:hypothetical protein